MKPVQDDAVAVAVDGPITPESYFYEEGEAQSFLNSPKKTHLENEMRTYTKDDFLYQIYNEIEFTKYHFFLLISTFFIRSFEGTEIRSLSISSSMIAEVFKLKGSASAYITLFILAGNFIGCLLSIVLSNSLSRKGILYLGSGVILIFGVTSYYMHNLFLIILSRCIVNIGGGLIQTGSTALVTESFNMKYRGFMLNLILISTSLGDFYISSSLNSFIKLDNPTDWSKLYLLAIFPVAIGALFIPLSADSLIFYVETHRYKEAYEACKKYYFGNFSKMENEFIDGLNSSEYKFYLSGRFERRESVGLFTTVKAKYSLVMIFNLFNSFIFLGIGYIIPMCLLFFHQNKQDPVALELQITAILTLVFSLIAGALIEVPSLSRLLMLKIILFTSCVLSFSTFGVKRYFHYLVCTMKLVTTLQDKITEIYSSEYFDTKKRVMLLGVFNLIQSISYFLSPYANDLITKSFGYHMNYLIYGIILVGLIVISCFLEDEQEKKQRMLK